jgi:hypothetical protein
LLDTDSVYHGAKPENDILSERFQEKEVFDELHRWFRIHIPSSWTIGFVMRLARFVGL